MAPESRFQEGERILCFHGPLIYEAKITKVEVGKDTLSRFFIHYHGWNKNWDEWVPEARILKYSDENVVKQKALAKAHEVKELEKKRVAKKRLLDEEKQAKEEENKKKKEHVFEVPRVPSPKPKSSKQEPMGTKRRKCGLPPTRKVMKPIEDKNTVRIGKKKEEVKLPDKPDATVESEELYKAKLEIKIKIPDELKPYIVDDWEMITRQKKLIVLPARITVEKIIQDYVRAKTANKTAAAVKNNRHSAIKEVTTGIKEYFNVMLGAQLLYKFERNQYAELLEEDSNMNPCKVYGSVHLLRLFVKLGGMLTYTPLGEKSVQLLLFYINDFMNYLKRNASTLFSIRDYYKIEEEAA